MNTAIVYSKPFCPYCERAKMLLKAKDVDVTEISAVDAREELVEKVTNETGQAPRTVPQIWLNGQYIGGFKELAEFYTSSK